MKKVYFNILLVVSILFITGCTNKEFSTNRYYEKYTKDEVLYAGKLAFSELKNKEFVIDSYRDKLEITNMNVVYNVLKHEDYVIEVKEDDCGTEANLIIKNSYNMKENSKFNLDENIHNDVWERIEFFLGKRTRTKSGMFKFSREYLFTDLIDINKYIYPKDKVISPTKDLSNCVIENEFKNGVIQDIIEQEDE